MFFRSSDKEDTSQISLKLAENSEFYKKTLKLRDTDGKWATQYDSVIQGIQKIYIDGKEKVFKPQVIVKSFEQQIPLTYYYIDTSSDISEDNLDSVMVK